MSNGERRNMDMAKQRYLVNNLKPRHIKVYIQPTYLNKCGK